MGYFTEGYKQGTDIQLNKITPNEHENKLKEVIKKGTYNDLIEWYNGFYKAMLDIDLTRLEQSFTALKEEAEKGKK